MLYYYIATDKKGIIREGEIEAPTEEAVLEFIQRQGLIPVSIKKKTEARALLKKGLAGMNLFQRVSMMDRILIADHLRLMLKAGVSLIEAIDILIDEFEKPLIKDVLREVKYNLQKGLPLFKTFENRPNQFPQIFTKLIKAGEMSGNLEVVLKELSKQTKKEYELIRKVRSAMAYPMILIAASGGLVFILLGIVLPRLSKAFFAAGFKLPFITRILINISNFVAANFILLIILFIGLVFAFFALRKQKQGRLVLEIMKERTPIVRTITKKIALARLTRVLATLLRSGIPILDALTITSDAISNEMYKGSLLRIKDSLSKGISLGGAFRAEGYLYPRLVISMIGIGERAGSLEVVLLILAKFYETEVDHSLKNLVLIVEPVLLLGLGLFVGFIALSIILPIYQLVSGVR